MPHILGTAKMTNFLNILLAEKGLPNYNNNYYLRKL